MQHHKLRWATLISFFNVRKRMLRTGERRRGTSPRITRLCKLGDEIVKHTLLTRSDRSDCLRFTETKVISVAVLVVLDERCVDDQPMKNIRVLSP